MFFHYLKLGVSHDANNWTNIKRWKRKLFLVFL